ncbi:alpha-L-fucosidase [Chitinophaga terrae (ex Kim and Jung 2007)]|uniref:alpha-L-fucosidase n=1 Tax=Chitinophaga terrae (ex Kim and Jung 2007) TaxID=408074 RepID=UPI002788C785|nr:alpha-L-fucosidase [Chitinophaga terrae (ex Kim and Jung 2007)]MDQ0110394.1 alpha-L-fucosidase [Chitinophaga terrae (ex Kim and Jung 2007)]
MRRRTLIKGMAAALPSIWLSPALGGDLLKPGYPGEPMARGPFKPTWESLQNYKTPDWFRDAKFGMWAHWGPQCQPESGDWYAREMYQEGSVKYKIHLEKYGHPSKFGFKDVINEWKGENWDPEELVSLYKNAGAQYFMAMANHHDNFDLYNSKYQKNWNATRIGPKKDLIGGWAKAAKNNGLPFGVSVHASHAWRWYESAQRSDKHGQYAGIPYDGKLTKADGKGKWWDGLDPQELYEQNHPLSENSWNDGAIHKQWMWGNGVYPPSKAYIEKFYNRTIDLINKYDPDVIYFDDSQLPFWPISDAGLRIAAHLYNKSIKDHGELRAVINGKMLDENQRKAMVWDIERGQANEIQPLPWQTDTCIGDWHYNRDAYNRDRYKTPKTVIQTLVDVVSKNGNLMLNVPVRGDGTIDEKERKVVEGITQWMKLNSESIYGTRPWKIFGEGPAQQSAAVLNAQGFNEGKGKPFTHEDIRFVTKGDILYATAMGWPDNGRLVIKSLKKNSEYLTKEIQRIEFLPTKQTLTFERDENGLVVSLPERTSDELTYANVIKVLS